MLDPISKLTFASMKHKRSYLPSVVSDDDSDGSASYSPSVADDNSNGGREYSITLRSLRTSHAVLHAHEADSSQAHTSELD